MLRIEMIDTGCGRDPETAKHLFQHFVQGDGSMTRTHDGAGLGLAITRMLAGDTTVVTSIWEGSTFALTKAPQA